MTLTKYKSFRFIIPLIFIFAIIFILIVVSDSDSTTFIEAYDIAKDSETLSDSYELIFASSVDLAENTKGFSENDGKRLGWNLCFMEPTADTQIYIEVKHGKIYSSTETKALSQEFSPIPDSKIKCDTDEILSEALSKFTIYPGSGWAIGYHFQIYNMNDISTICLICLDEAGMQQKIYYSLENGACLGSEVKEFVGGGIYKNFKDYIELDDSYGVENMNILSDSESLIWGFRANSQMAYDYYLLHAYESEYDIIDTLYNILYAWLSNGKIYILDESGIYSLINNNNWKNISSFDFDIIDFCIQKNKIYLLTSENIVEVNLLNMEKKAHPIPSGAIDINSMDKNIYLTYDHGIFEYTGSDLVEIISEDNYWQTYFCNEYRLSFKDAVLSIKNENGLIDEWEFASNIGNIYTFSNNDIIVVLQTNEVFYYKFLGGDLWQLEYNKIFDGKVSAALSFNGSVYLCITPISVWKSIEV